MTRPRMTARRIKCRFCSWSVPVWLGRESGWTRLVSHIVDKHPEVNVRTCLAAFGTTGAGMRAVMRQEHR